MKLCLKKLSSRNWPLTLHLRRDLPQYSSLTGKAKESIVEMNRDNLLNLTQFFESNHVELISYDKFERHMRPSDMSVVGNQVECETMTAKLRNHNVSLPEHVLAYSALNSFVIYFILAGFIRLSLNSEYRV